MEDPRDVLRKGFDEYRRFINPLVSQRAAIAGEPMKLLRTEGGLLYDENGLAIEDFHGTQAFGHRHPAIAQAVRDYLETDSLSWYPSRVNPWMGRYAKLLCERTGHYTCAFFGFTGADVVEAALKLARALTRRPKIYALTGAYHGCTYGAVSLMAKGYLTSAFGPFLEGVEVLPFGDTAALRAAFAEEGDQVAAVVVEPMQGEGGVRLLPDDYVAALCELTEEHGALLVADEVQTGLGRTGRGFLHTETWPRRPDVVVLAKQLGGGLIPVAAMLTDMDLFKRAYGSDFSSGESHNNTMGCNAVGAVAGMAALELVTDELVAEVREKGAWLKRNLHEALQDSPLFEEVRGEGLMLGVKLAQPDHPWLSFEHFGFKDLAGKPVIGPLLCHRLYKRGFFCFTCGHDWSVFRLQPRWEIPRETLTRFVDVVKEELAYLCELAET